MICVKSRYRAMQARQARLARVMGTMRMMARPGPVNARAQSMAA